MELLKYHVRGAELSALFFLRGRSFSRGTVQASQTP